jgi:hypothetical protein
MGSTPSHNPRRDITKGRLRQVARRDLKTVGGGLRDHRGI